MPLNSYPLDGGPDGGELNQQELFETLLLWVNSGANP